MRISLGAVSRPLESLKNKTGSWAVKIPKINEDKCLGCGECRMVCPDGCIELVDVEGRKVAKVDYDYCKGCGICSDVCPANAIEMVEKVIE
ncbi:4Fe-4S dicluster domain-containing protein [Archaeoglobus sp.]